MRGGGLPGMQRLTMREGRAFVHEVSFLACLAALELDGVALKEI